MPIVAVAAVAFALVQWRVHAPWRQQLEADDHIERLIASRVFVDAAAEDSPKWLRGLCGINRSQLWNSIQVSCESAEKLGFFPAECYGSWALAAHWFGDSSRYRELVSRVTGSSLRNRLAMAVEYGAQQADLDSAAESIEGSVATWHSYHVLSQLAGREDHEATLAAMGGMMLRRSVTVSLAGHVLIWSGLAVVAVWLVRGRKRGCPSRMRFALPSLWNPRTAVVVYCISSILGTVVSLCLATIPAVTWAGFATVSVFIHAACLGLPVICLAVAFTPGIRAMARLFGLVGFVQSKTTIVATALGVFSVLWLLDSVILSVGEWLRIDDLRDWFSLEMLNSPATLVSWLVTGVIIAPVCEEIVFRGFLYRAFQNRFGLMVSAFGSSLLFAAYHWYSLIGSLTILIL